MLGKLMIGLVNNDNSGCFLQQTREVAVANNTTSRIVGRTDDRHVRLSLLNLRLKPGNVVLQIRR